MMVVRQDVVSTIMLKNVKLASGDTRPETYLAAYVQLFRNKKIYTTQYLNQNPFTTTMNCESFYENTIFLNINQSIQQENLR